MTGAEFTLALLGWLIATGLICWGVGHRLRHMQPWDRTGEREEYLKAIKRVQGR